MDYSIYSQNYQEGYRARFGRNTDCHRAKWVASTTAVTIRCRCSLHSQGLEMAAAQNPFSASFTISSKSKSRAHIPDQLSLGHVLSS